MYMISDRSSQGIVRQTSPILRFTYYQEERWFMGSPSFLLDEVIFKLISSSYIYILT